MSASCPLPYFLEDFPIHSVEYIRRSTIFIIITPTFYDWIQHHNKWLLFYTLVGFYRLADFFAKPLCASLDGVVSSVLLRNFRILKPRKSNPSFICVIFVFSSDSVRPLSARNLRTNGSITCSIVSLSFAVTMKSSAYRTRCILGTIFCSSPDISWHSFPTNLAVRQVPCLQELGILCHLVGFLFRRKEFSIEHISAFEPFA